MLSASECVCICVAVLGLLEAMPIAASLRLYCCVALLTYFDFKASSNQTQKHNIFLQSQTYKHKKGFSPSAALFLFTP